MNCWWQKGCILLTLIFYPLLINAFWMNEDKTLPWFAGSLLSNSGIVASVGTTGIEPYIFTQKVYQTPPLYIQYPELQLTMGLFKRVDFQAVLPYEFQEAGPASDSGMGDISLIMGVQVVNSEMNQAVPNLRVILEETFPNGRFDNLNPHQNRADALGSGVYNTTAGAIFEQTYHIRNYHYLDIIFMLEYGVPSSTKINGFSFYGGGTHTKGTIQPGPQFEGDLTFQYSLSKHWAYAIDCVYVSQNSSLFRGNHDFIEKDRFHRIGPVGIPNNATFSLAPAIEYSFSRTLGIVVGSWFSVITENSNRFVSAVIALNYGYQPKAE